MTDIDVVPQTQKIKKTIAVNNEWEDRTFIRISTGPYSESPNELEKWCYTYYKEPKYLGAWWRGPGYVVLDEKTFVHWKLCE